MSLIWQKILSSWSNYIKEFEKLIQIANRLLGPNGCPWDQKQTFFTLQKYLLEEAHELIEAIDSKDPHKIVEELGDVLFTLVFIAKLGEKEKLFSFEDAAKNENEKLIRRHPHIFANEKIDSVEDIIDNWELIKKEEKARESILDGIPPTLPTITRAQKVIEKLKRSKSSLALQSTAVSLSEEQIGQRLWEVIVDAQALDIDAEGALRRYTKEVEKKHRRLIRGKN